VSVDVNGDDYTTPTALDLERKNEYVLTFSKEGYEQARIRISKHLSGEFLILDVLFTGLVGVVVDGTTGSWYNLKPESVTVSLNKVSAGPGPDKIKIAIEGSGQQNELEIKSSVPGVNIQVTPVK